MNSLVRPRISNVLIAIIVLFAVKVGCSLKAGVAFASGCLSTAVRHTLTSSGAFRPKAPLAEERKRNE